MQISLFYYWLFGIILLIGIGVILSIVFGKKRDKPAYNFRDEKRVILQNDRQQVNQKEDDLYANYQIPDDLMW